MFSSFNQFVDSFTNLFSSDVLWSFEFSIVSIFTIQKSSIFIKNQNNSSKLLQNIRWWTTKSLAWILSRIWTKNIDSSSSSKIRLTKKKLKLKINPIVYQRAIICRDTFCFRVRILSFKNLQYVAKFFWVFDKRRSKIDFCKLTREKKVKEIVKLFDHHRIINIANMREKLKFEKLYVFRNIVLNFAFFFSQFQFFFSIIWSAF